MMNKIFKYLLLLFLTTTLAQIFGKFYYFNALKFFTFEVGYLCLVEVFLIFTLIYISNKILIFYDDKSEEFNKLKPKSQTLFLLLAFIAGVHFVGGEFQNAFILKNISGFQMDMATFYDGIGHLFIFTFLLVLFYLLVRVEIISCNKRQSLSKLEVYLFLIQTFLFSLGATLTIIKSAFIFLCLIPLLFLFLAILYFCFKKKKLGAKRYPLLFFFSLVLFFTLVFLFIWLVLPYSLKKPIIKEYISLGENLEIKTSFQENYILKKITQTSK